LLNTRCSQSIERRDMNWTKRFTGLLQPTDWRI